MIILGSYALICSVPVAELLQDYFAHIPVAVIGFLLVAAGAALTHRSGEFWKTPLAKPYMALGALFIVAAGLGLYRVASLRFITEFLLRFHTIPLFCCAIAMNTKQVRHAYAWLAWGAYLLLFLCFKFGVMIEGRLAIFGTTLQNPNDLGFAILFVMSALLIVRSMPGKIAVVVSLPLFLSYILKTGSRADVMTLILLFGLVFYLAPVKWKIVMAVATPLAVVATVTVLPAETAGRLTTIVNPFSDDSQSLDESMNGRALVSELARKQLQERAIDLIVRHPLLGVGVHNFQLGIEAMIRETLGVKSGWQEAHNTYLQIGAEEGVPAMVLYIWTLVLCVKLNFQSYRTCRKVPQLSDAAMQSFALIIMTFMFIICTTFSNNSCDPKYNLMIGLTAANYLAVRREAAGLNPDPAPAFAPFGFNRLARRRPVAVAGAPLKAS